MYDALDEAIIAALLDDTRASHRALARRVGTTPPTLIARLRRLEELGAITGYRPILAPPPGTYECVSVETPPGQGIESTAYDDGTRRWTFTCTNEAALRAWTTRSQVTLHTVAAPVHVGAATLPVLLCHQCKGPLPEAPVTARIAGRHHVFCCTTCRERMRERAARLGASP